MPYETQLLADRHGTRYAIPRFNDRETRPTEDKQKEIPMKRRIKWIASMLLTANLIVAGSGCNQTTAPSDPGNNNQQAEAPVLPPAEKLDFAFDFFELEDIGSEKAEAARWNFFNARVRLAVIGVITEFVLTPPVLAFSLALHTVPSPQDDGSYIWVYTWVDGSEEAQIRLKGTPEYDHVKWELRVSNTAEDFANELWFEGESANDGDSGFWRFHDFNRAGDPIVARIDWLSEGNHEKLTFTDLDENPGAELAYEREADRHEVSYTSNAGDEDLFIIWNGDGTGSIEAADYNDGEKACWDTRQEDADCPVVISETER